MNKKIILNVLAILVIVSVVVLTNLPEKPVVAPNNLPEETEKPVIVLNYIPEEPGKIVIEEKFGRYVFYKEYIIEEVAGIKFIRDGSVLVTVDFQENLMPFYYHRIWFDEELNYPLGQLGARTCILDSDGRFISKGYHKLFLKDGQVYGQVGAKIIELVKIW